MAAASVRAAVSSGAAGNESASLKQESVWDYPRAPALQQVSQRLKVVLGGQASL